MNTTITKATIIAVAAAAAIGAAGLARAQGDDAARVLEVRDFVGRIEVDTSVGGPLRATVTPGRTGLTALVAQRGVNLVVDGDVRSTSSSCSSDDPTGMTVRIGGRRYSRDELPVLRVTGSPSIGVRVVNSVVEGRIGNVGGATVGTSGCGNLTIGDVRQDAEVSIAGSGDLVVGRIGRDLELNIAGGGDSQVGAVSGTAEINVAGSGNVRLEQAGQRLEVNIAGSGDVDIAGGESALEVSIAGSGNVAHNGVAIDPEVSIIGSGDVVLREIRGDRSFSSMGSGTIRVSSSR